VAVPFNEEYEVVFGLIRDVLAKGGFIYVRTDTTILPGLYTERIVDLIGRSRLVIADVTEPTPNVLYQVGIAHSLGKETVLITQDIQNLPFDVRDIRAISYDLSAAGAKHLQESLKEILSSGDDSP
jgi:hypothetical protein